MKMRLMHHERHMGIDLRFGNFTFTMSRCHIYSCMAMVCHAGLQHMEGIPSKEGS